MARKAVFLTLALVLFVGAAATASFGSALAGDGEVYCQSNGKRVACDPFHEAIGDAAFNAAGQIIIAAGAGIAMLGLIAVAVALVPFKPRGWRHAPPGP